MFCVSSPTNRPGWIAVTTCLGILFAIAIFTETTATPLQLPVGDDGRPVIDVREVGDNDNIVRPQFEAVNRWLYGKAKVTVSTYTPLTKWCGVKILVSNEYPFAGRTGKDRNGCPLTAINPNLADESTLFDEMAHQLRGHYTVPHLPRWLGFLDVIINVYLDTSNSIWWYGIRDDLWTLQKPERTDRNLDGLDRHAHRRFARP
jgi:hypothetical protein